jgi:hypothetical protein
VSSFICRACNKASLFDGSYLEYRYAWGRECRICADCARKADIEAKIRAEFLDEECEPVEEEDARPHG